jgi:dihydrodipicolinate synthase/N-acetylneuraminate lyase
MIRFRGLYPVLQTPFDDNGEVDFDSLRRLLSHLAEQGADGIVFPGFASEWWRLTGDEIQECAALIGARAVLNVTAQATVPAVRAAHSFAAMKPLALMLLPPFVVPAPVLTHIEEVLGAVDLPVILQDSAALTGMRVPPAALAAVAAKHPNLAGIKVDQVPTGPAIASFRSEPALRDLSYLVGYSGLQMLDAVRRGAEALMGGCAHLAEDRRMVNALLAGGGYAEYCRLLPLLNFEMQTIDLVIAVHKRLLFEQGIIATPLCRQPSPPLDATHLDELHRHIEALRA